MIRSAWLALWLYQDFPERAELDPAGDRLALGVATSSPWLSMISGTPSGDRPIGPTQITTWLIFPDGSG